MMKNYIIKGTGFTLIELLIVVAIIAILAGTVIMIINPGERLQDAREAAREANMTNIGQAIHLAVVDCGAGGATTTHCADVETVVDACQEDTSTNHELDADGASCPLDNGLDNLTDPLTGGAYWIENEGSNNVWVWAASSESTWYCNPSAGVCTSTAEGQYKRF